MAAPCSTVFDWNAQITTYVSCLLPSPPRARCLRHFIYPPSCGGARAQVLPPRASPTRAFIGGNSKPAAGAAKRGGGAVTTLRAALPCLLSLFPLRASARQGDG